MESLVLACSCCTTYAAVVPVQLAAAFRKAWDTYHRGPGHTPTTPAVVGALVNDRHAFVRSLETGDWGAGA